LLSKIRFTVFTEPSFVISDFNKQSLLFDNFTLHGDYIYILKFLHFAWFLAPNRNLIQVEVWDLDKEGSSTTYSLFQKDILSSIKVNDLNMYFCDNNIKKKLNVKQIQHLHFYFENDDTPFIINQVFF